MSGRIVLVAEAGVNHDGDPARALELVDAAARAGADAVKFQAFRAESLASATAPKATYQAMTTGAGESQRDMLRRLELAPEAFRAARARARERGIRFLSTPFDLSSLSFLADDLALDTLKIGSGDLTDAALLLAAARAGLPVILSTGMATLGEVEDALGALAFGYAAGPDERPARAAFRTAFAATSGRAALQRNVTLLHCTSAYPAPAGEANLRAMETLRRAFALPVGLSDHTGGIAVATAAAALGAAVIEKHLTLDKSRPGPDHAASLDPREFASLVAAVREVESALGDGNKRPQPSEAANRTVARKSLFARRAIAKGETFTAGNLGVLRPGDGVSAMDYFDRLGQRAARGYAEGEILRR
ncbi:MAG: N-acetylneuraminate synthase [Rhodospirillales bacterium]|nr:N-acetylneuraminate synthase [Rhodospirillales bacterium]